MPVGEKLDEKLAEASQSDEEWSLARLHDETKISKAYLYRVLRDRDQIPSRDKIAQIADALGFDQAELDELFAERDKDELARYLDRLGVERPEELAQLCVELRDPDPEVEPQLREKVREALELTNG